MRQAVKFKKVFIEQIHEAIRIAKNKYLTPKGVAKSTSEEKKDFCNEAGEIIKVPVVRGTGLKFEQPPEEKN